MTQLIRDIGECLVKHDPILGQIRSHPVSHGGSTRQVSEPKIVDTEMRRVDAMFEISRDAFLATDTVEFTDSMVKLFTSFHSQQKKHLFEVLDKTTDAVGNAIDAGGRNFWEAYIEMLEKTEMRFDKDGKHNNELYMHPDTAKKLENNPPTPEQIERIEKTIQAKRDEFYARKRTRRIAS
jgi:hypothetical protein